MNDSPQQDSGLPSKKNNSELASDDSEDDLDHEDRGTKSPSGQNHSNSSLATVAESAIEKLVGLAVIVPGAMISDDHQGVNDESQDDVQTEVFLDSDGHANYNTTCLSSPLGPEPCLVSEYSPTLSASRSVPPNNTEALDKTANVNNESIHPVTTTPSSPSSPFSSSARPTVATSEATSTSSATDASASKPCDIDASKDMLTEGQAFAYVGLCLVTANTLFQALEGKETAHAKESLESFVSKLINRLYKHLEIDANSKFSVVAHLMFDNRIFADPSSPVNWPITLYCNSFMVHGLSR